MAVYCAFLRGVNVNGRAMKMRDVCKVFAEAGMAAPAAVLATGNIVFGSADKVETLRHRLKGALSAHYAYDVDLFVKTAEEVRGMAENAPFAPDAALHVYVFVCEPGFEDALAEEFQKATPVAGEAAAVKNGFFYWQVPKGETLHAGFSKILGRKEFKSKFTSRNLNTMVKVCEKMRTF